MCGIAGILDENHHLENQKIIFKDMIQSMKHRGPTSDGLYLEDHIALMHTRLAIVDVEKGLQPMHIGDYTIIYNGECYNTEELRCDLEEKGIVFHTSCDTEVILNAYIYYKENCLHMINGIFAFAIYNSKDKCLFLARDPMGVKPLFYTFVNQILVFASEIKTLLTYPLVKPIIDEHSIHQIAYLGPGRMSGNGVFKNIYEIKGGEYATYSSSSFQIHSYFELKAEPHIDSYEETVEKVRSLVFDSIERQLVSDVKIGAFLSGGLDSSIICAVAANHYKKEGKQLSTFSLEFEENDLYFIPNHFQPTSDIPYIDLMVSTFETKHTKIKLKSSDLINALYKAVDARDLPGMADVDTALLCFCEEVKKHVDVVLSGECADEIFGGYPWFQDQNRPYFPWTQNLEYRHSLLLNRYQIDYHHYVGSLYHNSIQKAPLLKNASTEDIAIQQMTYLNIHWFMQTLLDRKDRMSMASGLEARVPFCDTRILNYVYSIPWEYKNHNQKEKGLLREAMKNLLPKEISERKKSPFPKTHHPEYLRILRQELIKISKVDEPLWKIFNKEEILKLCDEESSIPWYGQLMTTPQTIAYLLQINYWIKKYKIQIQ